MEIDLDDIGDHTSLVPIPARPTRPAPPAASSSSPAAPPCAVIALVTHGDDVCVVLAPDQRELDRVVRERRVKLGLAGRAAVQRYPWEVVS